MKKIAFYVLTALACLSAPLSAIAGGKVCLFQSRTTNGNGDTKYVNFPSGAYTLKGSGTWNGASVHMEWYEPLENEWIDLQNDAGSTVTLSASGARKFESPYNQAVRGVMSNAGGSTDVTLCIEGLQ